MQCGLICFTKSDVHCMWHRQPLMQFIFAIYNMKGKDKDVGDKITSNCLHLYKSIFFLVWDSHRMRDEGWRIVGSMKRSWFKNLKMIFYRQQYARMQFWMLVSSFICLSSNLNLLCPSMAIGYIRVVQTWLGSFAEAILRPHCFLFVFFYYQYWLITDPLAVFLSNNLYVAGIN